MRTPIAEKLAELRKATDRIIAEKAPRKSFTPKQRQGVFTAYDGLCAGCDEPLKGKWQVDHILPLDLEGSHDPSNWQPLCGQDMNGCHVAKTREDIRRIAAARRIRKREAEGAKPSSIQSAREIQSRGFDKTKTRTFGGQVKFRKARA